MHDWCVSIKGHQKFVVPRLIFHSLFKKTERASKSTSRVGIWKGWAQGSSGGEVWHNMVVEKPSFEAI